MFFIVVEGGIGRVDYATDQLAELHRKLSEHFSDEELETLCFDLGVDYADLPAQGKAAKARDLVALMHRQGRIAELIATAARQRPNVSWEMEDQHPGDALADRDPRRGEGLFHRLLRWGNPPGGRTGDVIVAEIGSGAHNSAVGKNLVGQVNINVPNVPSADDRQVIEEKLNQVAAALDQARGQVDASVIAVADFQMKLLRGELAKTNEGDTPSATTILQVGDSLLTSLPQIKPALKSLFTAPAVSRVVAKAGKDAVDWVRARFG